MSATAIQTAPQKRIEGDTRRYVWVTSTGWLQGECLPVCEEFGNGSIRVEILRTRGVYYAGEVARLMPGDFTEA